MIKINLLPWRKQLRLEKANYCKIIFIVSAIISLAAIAIIHIILQDELKQLSKSVNVTQEQLINLQRQAMQSENISKEFAGIKNKFAALQALSTIRHINNLILSELSKIIPGDLYFFSVTKNAKEIVINGNADTLNAIAKLMRSISNSQIFNEPQLISSKINNDTKAYSFTMKLQINELPTVKL